MHFDLKSHPQLLRKLIVGSSGKLQLMALAQDTLIWAGESEGEDLKNLVKLAVNFLLAAWESDPFDGQLAGQLLDLHAKLYCLDPYLYQMLQQVVLHWHEPQSIRYLKQLRISGDLEKIRAVLKREISKQPNNLFWWQQVLTHAIYESDIEWSASLFEAKVADVFSPVFIKIKGDLALSRGDFQKADDLYSLLDCFHSLPDMLFRQAICKMKIFGLDKARPLLQAGVLRHPWHINRVLQTYDIISGRAGQDTIIPEKVSILLYSHNKCEVLDSTLQSLWESRLNNFIIFVLNNGSTDGTEAMLRRWQDIFGLQSFIIINLPINIGAPAARNWLMHIPEVQNSPYIAFMDDDIVLPPNWLARLGTAKLYYPHAGVWGCQVVDYYRPTLIQNADLHIQSKDDWVEPNQTNLLRHFKTSSLHDLDLNYYQFNYLRPCASVTGCCHLFCTQTLLNSGFFDIAFSPSQFDDVDHDLRLALDSKPAVYQGNLTIRHKKLTGRLNESATAPETEAHIYLLQKKYDPENIIKIIDWEREMLVSDFLPKMAFVRQELGRG